MKWIAWIIEPLLCEQEIAQVGDCLRGRLDNVVANRLPGAIRIVND